MKYVCDICGWVYDEDEGYPEGGIAPGTKWEDVPEDFECPVCYVGKDQFSEADRFHIQHHITGADFRRLHQILCQLFQPF